MKKILLLFVFVLSFLLNADAQYSNKHRSSVRYDSGPKISLCVTGAGVVFYAAVFLPVPDYTWISTPIPGNASAGHWQQKPFM